MDFFHNNFSQSFNKRKWRREQKKNKEKCTKSHLPSLNYFIIVNNTRQIGHSFGDSPLFFLTDRVFYTRIFGLGLLRDNFISFIVCFTWDHSPFFSHQSDFSLNSIFADWKQRSRRKVSHLRIWASPQIII